MLDYLEVKKFHAQKLVDDATGGGRVESAFYHTMKMVYLKGVEDGAGAMLSGDGSGNIGITDREDQP